MVKFKNTLLRLHLLLIQAIHLLCHSLFDPERLMFIVEVGVLIEERCKEIVFLAVVSGNITDLRTKSIVIQLTCTISR